MTLFTAIAAAAAFASPAQAAIVAGVTATAGSELFGDGTTTSRMVDGTGIVSGEGAGGLHAHGSIDDDWRVGSVANNPWVKFDLGATVDVGNMFVWNSLGSGLPDFAIREIDIYYATTDPGNNVNLSLAAFDATDWTPWGTVAEMAQIPGAADYGPTTTTALNVNARYIAFDIKKGWNTGDSPANSAIAEVQFDAIPEPGTMGLLALSGLALLRRRRA